MNELVETRNDLLADLGIDHETTFPVLDALVDTGAKYVKDARINLKNTLSSEHLTGKETALIAYAVAVNNGHAALRSALAARARDAGATGDELAEMASCASLLAVNNVLYRFRHFVGKESYTRKQARIRMSIMARPVTGSAFFELVSLAVSAVNGCEACVSSHERSVLEAGMSEDQVFDAIRIASVITGLGKLLA